ncbi:hypothetical protein ABLV17_11470, partial [Klebsiella sp. CN_Kp091]|uniref:hypothetical protein n=1 Tax=unclassified Klebsiella TaxID=2608929 RepID=UPI0032B38235
VCSPGKRSATGERFPDSGWRLIRAAGPLRFVAPVSQRHRGEVPGWRLAPYPGYQTNARLNVFDRAFF